MLRIKIPDLPPPIPKIQYLPLTKEEQIEADFYKKRKSLWQIPVGAVIFLLLLFASGYILDFICGKSPIYNWHFLSIPRSSIILLFFPLSLLILVGVTMSIVDWLPCFKASKSVQEKLSQTWLREEELKNLKYETERYNRKYKEYLEDLANIEETYPGIKDCRYDTCAYSRKITSDIIENINEVFDTSKALIEHESEPSIWSSCSDREFEIKTARWYQLCGYNVELTPKSNDGGIDVIAHKGKKKIYIQCKQYKSSSVPVAVARELYGVMSADNVNEGAIVCIWGGDKGTRDFAAKNNIKIITTEEICIDISNRVKSFNHDMVSCSIQNKGNYTLYIGYGTFEVINDVFSDISDIIDYVKKHYEWENGFEFAIIQWKCNTYLILRYRSDQRRFLSEQIISYVIDNKSLIPKKAIGIKTNASSKQTRKKKERHYYKRWYY